MTRKYAILAIISRSCRAAPSTRTMALAESNPATGRPALTIGASPSGYPLCRLKNGAATAATASGRA